jgi:hypothetical protein
MSAFVRCQCIGRVSQQWAVVTRIALMNDQQHFTDKLTLQYSNTNGYCITEMKYLAVCIDGS